MNINLEIKVEQTQIKEKHKIVCHAREDEMKHLLCIILLC